MPTESFYYRASCKSDSSNEILALTLRAEWQKSIFYLGQFLHTHTDLFLLTLCCKLLGTFMKSQREKLVVYKGHLHAARAAFILPECVALKLLKCAACALVSKQSHYHCAESGQRKKNQPAPLFGTLFFCGSDWDNISLSEKFSKISVSVFSKNSLPIIVHNGIPRVDKGVNFKM